MVSLERRDEQGKVKWVLVRPRYDNKEGSRSDPRNPLQPIDGKANVWYGGPAGNVNRGPAGHSEVTPLPSASMFDAPQDESVGYIAQLVCRSRSNVKGGTVLFQYYWYSKSVDDAQGNATRKFSGGSKSLDAFKNLEIVER